jgi:hypothetical protein
MNSGGLAIVKVFPQPRARTPGFDERTAGERDQRDPRVVRRIDPAHHQHDHEQPTRGEQRIGGVEVEIAPPHHTGDRAGHEQDSNGGGAATVVAEQPHRRGPGRPDRCDRLHAPEHWSGRAGTQVIGSHPTAVVPTNGIS